MNANVSLLLNEQINKEFYSAYLYLDFANYYAAVGLDGFENWYRVQAQEERDHAMLFYQYLQNNGEGVNFAAIADKTSRPRPSSGCRPRAVAGFAEAVFGRVYPDRASGDRPHTPDRPDTDRTSTD